ncbi:MAG: undecaprenyldiphospho-muramoylpentapeptide beta-N-acetylglucosaminyltransferase [bacterium]
MKNRIKNSITHNDLLIVLFTGGATGGHLYPAIAIAEEISKNENCVIGFAGSRKGIESRVIPEKGYRFYPVWISGIQRGKIISNLLLPLKIVVSLIQALIIILTFKPHIIVGTGGYVSWPVLAAGIMLRKKIVIQEQNQFPGLVTRLIAPFANSVHLSYKSSTQYFKRKSDILISGNPTRRDLENKNPEESYKFFQLDANKITLLILGGSQGSLFINKMIIQYLPILLKESELQILWSTGENWYEWIKKETGESARIKILPYIREIGSAYTVCDLIICRAGATTIAEITRMGIPAVFIPLSTSAAGHQIFNAQMLAEAGAAEMIMENEVDDKFIKVIHSLLKDKNKREKMGEKAKDFSRPGAAKTIVSDILKEIKDGKKS